MSIFRRKRTPVEIPSLSHLVAAASEMVMLRDSRQARKLRDRHLAAGHCRPETWNAEVDRMIAVVELHESEDESKRHKVLAALRTLYA